MRFHAHKQHKRRTVRRLWVWLLVPLIGCTLAFASTLLWYNSSLRPLSESVEQIVVIIPTGTSAPEIGTLLEDQQVIRSARAFDWYVRLNNYRGSLQAGGYSFSPSETVKQIVEKLINGEVSKDLVTVLPAQRIDQIKASMTKQGFGRDEVNAAFEFNQYADHPVFQYGTTISSLEGYLYPESFSRTIDTKLETIIRASLDEMSEALTPEIRAGLAAQGLTVHEGIILASIIEREVSKSDDRPIVAQVFLKRYKEGIMLGSDPTALYGALYAGIEPSVSADTPYNTRLYTGLPPGPIGNVSKSGLEALTNPANSEYLFFVSGDDGVTYFSNTLSEHEALTARHCIELCRSY